MQQAEDHAGDPYVTAALAKLRCFIEAGHAKSKIQFMHCIDLVSLHHSALPHSCTHCMYSQSAALL
jgi:hypothetical protein